MDKAGDDGTNRIVRIEEAAFPAGAQLTVTGAKAPYYRGWWDPARAVFVKEVIHADGTVDRWENGLPITS